ncbi:hypothetical protein [Azotosporobacter soli]|uniref:hypothetical protein n=1 Tax=Azotosporobacter soli TaxID=3055040 RepID=UPI0031FE7F99
MEFMKWKEANRDSFNWWSYVNLKADLQTALGFAKFYWPEIVEVDGCIILKDKFSKEMYDSWKEDCKGEKTCIEKTMNLYQLRDFFHINTQDDGNLEEQIETLGNILLMFWNMSFKARFPERSIEAKVVRETDGELFITVFEDLK